MSKIYFILATSHSGEILVFIYLVGQKSGEIPKLVNSGDHSGRARAGLKSWGYCWGGPRSGSQGQPGPPGGGHGCHDWPRDWCRGQGYQSHWQSFRFFNFFFVQRFLQEFWRLIFQEWARSSGNYFVNFVVSCVL